MILKELSEILQVLARVFLRVAHYFFLGFAFLSAVVSLLTTLIYMFAHVEVKSFKEDKSVVQSEDLQIRKKHVKNIQTTVFFVMLGSSAIVKGLSIVRTPFVIEEISKRQILEELIK